MRILALLDSSSVIADNCARYGKNPLASEESSVVGEVIWNSRESELSIRQK